MKNNKIKSHDDSVIIVALKQLPEHLTAFSGSFRPDSCICLSFLSNGGKCNANVVWWWNYCKKNQYLLIVREEFCHLIFLIVFAVFLVVVLTYLQNYRGFLIDWDKVNNYLLLGGYYQLLVIYRLTDLFFFYFPLSLDQWRNLDLFWV